VLLGLLALVLTAFAYHTVTNITKADIFAYHQLDRQAVGASFTRAGDIVAISPDGTRMEAVCVFDLEEKSRREAGLDAVYVNDLGRQLPSFPDLMSLISTGSAEAGAGERDAIPFRGRYHEIAAAADVAPLMTEACECEMARRLNRREKVCTTIAALTEEADGRALAIRFATHSNIVPEAVFKRCGLDRSPAAEAMEAQTCTTHAEIPWDVKLRAMLRLIEEHPRTAPPGEQAAASDG
jgi:hypothetical protein